MRYPTTWPRDGIGGRSRVRWESVDRFDLGSDPTGRAFEEIASHMMGGCYYPKDVIELFGTFQIEGRGLIAGDQVRQSARAVPFLSWPKLTSFVEIIVADRSESECTIGYVTTVRHHAKGKWSAWLQRQGDGLSLEVSIVVSPRSLLFWIGIPYARWLQVRAKRKAVDRFRAIVAEHSQSG